MGTRRAKILKIRFSDDEWKRIRATFPKRKVSTALRALGLGEPPPRRSPALEVRRETLLTVARLGNNLNQIARAINRANLAGDKVDAIRLLARLVEIQNALDQLL